jgi:VIT1/CCC1 family predicted Fe2+/Mn2+ transporter
MTSPGPPGRGPDAAHHPGEPHGGGLGARLNRLRAGVLGANDGIVSVAGLVVGVAGVTTERGPLFTAGIAGLVAGAVSMALGEYVSVSSQRDSERAQLDTEERELREEPERELAELAALYEAKGLRPETARTVAVELTERDALAAHLDVELSIDPDNLTNPWQAAGASALAFVLGAVLPLLAILLPPPACREPVRGLRHDEQVAPPRLPRVGPGDQPDPPVQHVHGRLTRVLVLGQLLPLHQRDQRLAQHVLVPADDGVRAAPCGGLPRRVEVLGDEGVERGLAGHFRLLGVSSGRSHPRRGGRFAGPPERER